MKITINEIRVVSKYEIKRSSIRIITNLTIGSLYNIIY